MTTPLLAVATLINFALWIMLGGSPYLILAAGFALVFGWSLALDRRS